MANLMNLSIVNPSTSGATSDQIYVCILGTDPTNNKLFGHLDFATGKLVTSSSDTWMLDPATMTQTLDKLTGPIAVPAIDSARIYISVFDNFATFPASGPSPSADNKVMFDKIEFTTASNPNINGTCVDFYGLSYTITATDTNTGNPVTIGMTDKRSSILKDFYAIPTPTKTSQETGNTGIFEDVMLSNGKNVTRVLAPKTAALTDWGTDTHAMECSHFFDDYINKECWKPGRTFSCYSKMYNPSNPSVNNEMYYGKVSSDGMTLNLFTDASMKTPYTVASLPRPSVAWPNPDFSTDPSLYQNINSSTGAMDWGFLLFANTGTGSGLGNFWSSDPVAMAIMVSICRGVMHMDNGCVDWVDSTKYYNGDNGTSTSDLPIFYYSSILHQHGLNGKAYVLSYDDVYGKEPTIYFANHPDVTITLNSVEAVDPVAVGATAMEAVA